MSDYPDARRMVVTLADLRRVTILERARAAATVGVTGRELAPLMRAISTQNADAPEVQRGIELLYAMVWQLARRTDPGITWADAQAWDVALDLDAPLDAVAEAEAEAVVREAIGSGLPPAAAGELTLAHADAYERVRREQAAATGRPRRRGRRR